MKKIYLFMAAALTSAVAFGQTFTNASSNLPGSYNSGGVTGVMDADNDGLDDIIVMDQSTHVYILYQQPNGSFQQVDYGSVSNEAQWGMCVGDIDNDGHVDIMAGGNYDGVHILNINGPGSYTLTDPENVSIFMQACNIADINNDGWLDGFACHDDGPAYFFRNNGSGTFVDGNDMIDYNVYPGSDMSGNYGSVWSDVDRDRDTDLMVAKCRQFISDPYDPRRTNMIFINDGSSNYDEQAAERGLINLQQSWTVDFGDIDNDGDFDCFLTTHSATLQIYENDGFGYFTNITDGCFKDENGVVLPASQLGGFFLQGKLVDFDNDGYLDLIHAGGDHNVYHNNGNNTFNRMATLFPANDTMHGFATGDLNNDGWVDVYANYGNSYVTPDNGNDDRLFINNGGTNHWIGFDLEGTISNKQAVGAIVEIYGPFGRQIREIRAGESYGMTTSALCLFGLGSATEVTHAVIYWPAGGTQVITNPAIDQYNEYIEGACFAPTATVSATSYFLCEGSTSTLSVVEASASYLWSTGATTPTIEVSEVGHYNVIVYNNDGCAAESNSLDIQMYANQSPTITVEGELEFCAGQELVLTSSAGDQYSWTSGEETQSIAVTESGTYAVTVSSICGSNTSESYDVVVYEAAAAPTANGVTINAGGSADLSATGSNINWYDSATATTPIATGNTYSTPALNASTTYWVEDVLVHQGVQANGGKTVNGTTGNSAYHNSSTYYLKFDVYEDLMIKNVKVYANGAGSRTIQVIDANGVNVTQGNFNLPDGESVVTLDFFVPAGTGYGLRCTNSNPQLWRDRDVTVATPFNYPYALGTLGSITGTNVTGADADNVYYFFYDWNVETPTFECASPRVEVEVTVLGIEEISSVNSVSIYPNPASEQFTLTFNNTVSSQMQVNLIDATGRIVASKKAFAGIGKNNVEMNVNNLAAGIYQLQMVKDGEVASRAIIIE